MRRRGRILCLKRKKKKLNCLYCPGYQKYSNQAVEEVAEERFYMFFFHSLTCEEKKEYNYLRLNGGGWWMSFINFCLDHTKNIQDFLDMIWKIKVKKMCFRIFWMISAAHMDQVSKQSSPPQSFLNRSMIYDPFWICQKKFVRIQNYSLNKRTQHVNSRLEAKFLKNLQRLFFREQRNLD